ncbi:MAG: DUF4124 domain-containing protein [Methylophilaceae bacterium]
MTKIHYLKLSTPLLLCLAFCLNANAAGKEASAPAGGTGKRIVKWVDSQGVTHYGDKLPAQDAGRNNTEINNQGVVLKRNIKTDATTEQVNEEKLAQQRKDSILLASYTKAEEIDLARDRSLQMDQAALQALSVQKENIAGRSARNQKTAEGFSKRNKPLPPYLSEELKLANLESSKIDKQIAARKLSMEATRKHFANEKLRFNALKEAKAPETTSSFAVNAP